MTLDHIAIWTCQPEELRDFYLKFFHGKSGPVYTNDRKQYRSYFVHFDGGARIEIMCRPDIPDNLNDTVSLQHKGIIHLAFGVDTMEEVENKAKEMEKAGFPILSGPRKTGDGCYEFETLDPDKNRIEVTTPYTTN